MHLCDMKILTNDTNVSIVAITVDVKFLLHTVKNALSPLRLLASF